MNLVANWQGAAKKCELSVGITLHTRETQHSPAISFYNKVFIFGLNFISDFDACLKGRAQIFQELRVLHAALGSKVYRKAHFDEV